MTAPTRDDFDRELDVLLRRAEELGFTAVELSAGNLHRRVGGYPGADHRMPVCCDALRSAMKPTDLIVSEPPKGQGASLVIRFNLPHPAK